MARNHHSAPNPRANYEHRGADIKQRMRFQWRIKSVKDGALSTQNRDSRRHRPDNREPERKPSDASSSDPAQVLLCQNVAESHNKKGRKDQRHKNTVRCHRSVVEGLAPMWEMDIRQ